MSTRGLWGFRKNDKDMLTYNHSDSYPEWLGKKICEFITDMSEEELERLLHMLVPVNENRPATAKRIQLCKELGIADFTVSSGKETDYYCLLRKTQGNFKFYKELVKNPPACMKGNKLPFIRSNSFILNSLFCEYAYILNLDAMCLEFWIGNQKKPDETNRYGMDKDDGYYPCKMFAAYPFSEIRNKGAEAILKDMNARSNVYDIVTYYAPIRPEDVMEIVRNYMSEDEIDHHGNGNGFDDLYLKKTEVSKAIVDNMTTKSLVTEFVSQIDGNVWYDLPFLYSEKEEH